jgi:hypothetical protein
MYKNVNEFIFKHLLQNSSGGRIVIFGVVSSHNLSVDYYYYLITT